MQSFTMVLRQGRIALAAGACALALSLGVAVAPAHAVTAAEVEAQAQDVLVQMNAMQATLDEYSEQYFHALYDYQVAVENRDAAQERIDGLTEEIAQVQSRLGSRAREMYRGGPLSFLDLLFGAASFEELTTNWDLLNRLNESDAELSARAKELRTQNEAEKAEFDRQAAIADQKAEEAAQAYADAQGVIAEMQATYDSLSAEAQELYRQEAAAQAAAEAAERERRAQEAAAAQAAAEAQAAAAAAAQQAQGGGAYADQTAYVNDDGTVTDAATGEVYESAAAYNELTGNEVVDRARSMIGQDYVWGGTGGDWGGFDCSGLVSYALTGQTGVRLGTTATFIDWNQVSDPQPGDVAVIHEENGSQHTGIYIGDGKMIHASTYGVGVIEGDVQEGMIFVRP